MPPSEFVSSVMAKSRSGTKKKPEFWPGQPPPCCTTWTPSAVCRRWKLTPAPSVS
jgi:hypothetical protein